MIRNNKKFQSRFQVRSHRRRSHRRRGAALIEFALISVLFLTMLLGMLQFGIYLSAVNTLWNGAREGARLAAVQESTLSTAAADAQIFDQIAKTIAPLERSKMSIVVTPTENKDRVYGKPVNVVVTYDMRSKLFVPVPSYWFGKPLGQTYSTNATMRKENEN